MQVILNLAHTERLAGNHEAAAARFKEAVALAPDDVWAMVELAREEYALGHVEDSHQCLVRALEREPFHPGVVVCCAQHALVVGDIEKAYEIYKDAVEHQPKS